MTKPLHARIDAAVQAARTGEAAPAAPEGTPAPDVAQESPKGAPAAPAVQPEGQQTPENILETQPTPEALAEQERASKRQLIEARLAEARDRRRIADEARRAKVAREEAEKLKTEALSEKQKYDALRTGTFRETLQALGRDPLETFKEMQREAIEANTPEAQIRQMRADFEKQIGEKLKPLEETIAELRSDNERLRSLEAQRRQAAYQATLEGAFLREMQDPAFQKLRVEYDDPDLFGYVDHFDKNPRDFFAAAKAYGVGLTDPSQGFTMREILLVLKAAQDAHDQGRQQRQARFAPQAPAAPSAPSKTRTVNGTAERRNAGETIENDLAQERASPGRQLSRSERIQAEIERLSGR